MKQAMRNSVVILVALLYCLTVGIYGGASLRSVSEQQQQSQSASCFLAAGADNLLCHVGQQKSSGNSGISLPVAFKNTIHETTLAVRSTANRYFSVLSRYIFYSDRLICRLEKPDIVYPFHSFW